MLNIGDRLEALELGQSGLEGRVAQNDADLTLAAAGATNLGTEMSRVEADLMQEITDAFTPLDARITALEMP